MGVYETFYDGVQVVVDNTKEKDARRIDIPEGIRVLHASDLGKCPVRLYYELMNYERTRSRSYSRQLFLEDGFKHEETLREILELGTPEGIFIAGNMQVPSLHIEDTNIEVWGEADIVAYTEGSYPLNPLWVVESKALYHNTFEKYTNDPSTIPFFYFVQLAFYIVQLGAVEGTLILKDRERSEYYPDPRVGSCEKDMDLTNAQAKDIISRMVKKVEGILAAPPSIPDNVLEECRFCPYHQTCYSSILVGNEHDDPEPLVLVGKTDGLSKNITEAIRAGREIEAQLKELKATKSSINSDLSDVLTRGDIKKIVTDAGTVLRVTRRGAERLTKEGKVAVAEMKQDGTLPTETSPDSYYLRYGKGADKDET